MKQKRADGTGGFHRLFLFMLIEKEGADYKKKPSFEEKTRFLLHAFLTGAELFQINNFPNITDFCTRSHALHNAEGSIHRQ